MKRFLFAIALLVTIAPIVSLAQCTGTQSSTITPNPGGTCVPGTVYTVCYTMVGYNQLGANWVDGFEVLLTGPWVPGSLVGTTPPANCNGGGGNWIWSNSVTGTSSGQTHGTGYYFDLNPDGNPGNDFGDNGPGCTWTMCFQVTVGNTPGATLTIAVEALSDGEVGSWGSTACNGTPYTILSCIIDNPCGTVNAVVDQNESCPGNANGQATVTMTGGQAPITYSWNTVPVQNTQTATGLSAGNYTATVTDANGCTLTDNVTITTGSSSDATINNINATNTLCQSAAPVQLTTVQAGGSFSGPGVSATGLFTPADANIGSNTISYMIGGACPDTETINITIVQDADATIVDPIPGNPTNTFCVDDPAVQLNATDPGGTWTGPGVSPTGLFTPTTAGIGNHAITYTIANPCGDSDVINIIVNASSDATINNVNANNELCQNDAAVQLTTLQGGGTFSGPGVSVTGLFTPSAANLGTNTITYTIGGNCSDSQTLDIDVIQNADATITPVNATNQLCTGNPPVQLTAATGSGTWTGTGVNANGMFDPATSGVGNHVITYTVGNPCGDVQTMTINVSDLTFTVASTASVCTADNGTATATTTSGTAPFTYAWSNTQTGQTAIDLAPGNYTVTVSDALGCSLSQPAVVGLDPSNLSVSIPTSNNVSCNGACDGDATALTAGGTAPFQYLWDDPTFQQTIQATALCPNTYNVGVMDANGCLATAQVVISEPTALSVSAVMDQQSDCGQPNGEATATAMGGASATGTYTYSWNSVPVQAGATATGLAPGTYTVTAIDDNGCTVTNTVAITSTPGFTASIASFTDASCYQSCNGTATVAASSAAIAPITYAWNSVPAQINSSATSLCAGTYQVVVTDAVGCIANASVTIAEPTQISSQIATSASPICIGQSANLSAVISGGTPAYSGYTWTAAPADPTLTGSQQNPTVSPVVTTTYTFTADDANGCTSPAQTVQVVVRPTLALNVTRPSGSADTAICIYDSAVLNLSATGGDGNYSYYMLPDIVNPISLPIQIQPTTTTTYNFIVNDGCGSPTAAAASTVTVHPLPTPRFAGDDLQGCHQHTTQFTDQSTPVPVAWSWNFGDPGSNSNTSPLANPSHQFSSAGLYTISLSVTSANGCVADTTYPQYVEVYPLPYANFEASPERINVLLGNIDFTDLSSSNVSSWYWTFGDGNESDLQNPENTYLDTGVFLVTLWVETVNGCTDFTRRSVTIDPDFMFYVPNTFTPNGDGRNDYFRGYGEGIKWETYELFVYNRWGEEIYYTNSIDKPWNGWYMEREAPDEVYVWKIQFYDQQGESRTYRGRVTLMR